jgi:hypothetical protein
VIGTDDIGSCNSNYHTITATTAPLSVLTSTITCFVYYMLILSVPQHYFDHRVRLDNKENVAWTNLIVCMSQISIIFLMRQEFLMTYESTTVTLGASLIFFWKHVMLRDSRVRDHVMLRDSRGRDRMVLRFTIIKCLSALTLWV